MIVHLRGELVEKDPCRVVVEAAGVGYELFIPVSTYDRLPRTGEQVRVLVSHCIREDDELLFGFATPDERDLFLKLTSVSGVGPKIALAVLSGLSVSELATAIASGDAKRLAAVKGVGKRTAEKICVELRDKVDPFAGRGERGPAASPVLTDAVAALRALGFNDETCARMVSEVVAQNPQLDNVEQIIRLALSRR